MVDAPVVTLHVGDVFTSDPTPRDGDPGDAPHFARWWRIEVAESGVLTLDTLDSIGGDPLIEVYDSDLNPRPVSEDNNRVHVRVGAGQTCHIKVGTSTATGDGVTSYVLRARLRTSAITGIQVTPVTPVASGAVWKTPLTDVTTSGAVPGDRVVVIAVGGSLVTVFPAEWRQVHKTSTTPPSKGIMLERVAAADWWANGGTGTVPELTWNGALPGFIITLTLAGGATSTLVDSSSYGPGTYGATVQKVRTNATDAGETLWVSFCRGTAGQVTTAHGDRVYGGVNGDSRADVFRAPPAPEWDLTWPTRTSAVYFAFVVEPRAVVGDNGSLGTWSTPTMLSDMIPDLDQYYSFTEGDLVSVDDDVVVVCSLNASSLSIYLWAIDTSADEPQIVQSVFNVAEGNDTYYGLPLDPKGWAIDDIHFCARTGPRRFVITGEPSEQYDETGALVENFGTRSHLASFFYVNNDLTITREKFVTYSDIDIFTEMPHVAPWVDGTVVLTSHSTFLSDIQPVLVVDDQGTVRTIPMAPLNPHVVTVSGDVALVWSFAGFETGIAGRLSKIDLPSGTVVDHTDAYADFAYDAESVLYGTTLADGRCAFIGRLGANPFLSSTSPIHLLVVDPDTLQAEGPYLIEGIADNYGWWIGEWLSNVRSVQPLPDGTLTVSCMTNDTDFELIRVDPDTGRRLSTEAIAGITGVAGSSSSRTYWARHVTMPDGRVAAVFAANTGVHFAYHQPEHRPGFIGWWDGEDVVLLDQFPPELA